MVVPGQCPHVPHVLERQLDGEPDREFNGVNINLNSRLVVDDASVWEEA